VLRIVPRHLKESRELRDATLKKFRVLLTRELKPGERSDQFSPA
jgi:hypothetical protein